MGGVGFEQVVGVALVAAAAAFLAGSLGSTIALWREKTFQTLAATALAIVVWTGFWETADRGLFGEQLGRRADGESGRRRESVACRARGRAAVLSNAELTRTVRSSGGRSCAVRRRCRFVAKRNCRVARARVEPDARTVAARAGIERRSSCGAARLEPRRTSRSRAAPERAATTAVAGRGLRRTRTVWDNPTLWREISTWAYGRRVLLIRLVYVLVSAAALWSIRQGAALHDVAVADLATAVVLPAVLGLLLINMQAVTAVTSERDARALDLLLVTDLTPKEFVFGKLFGSLYNTKEMLLLPLVACAVLWRFRIAGAEACLLLGDRLARRGALRRGARHSHRPAILPSRVARSP